MGCKTAPEILHKTANETVVKVFDFANKDLEDGEEISTVISTTISPTGVTVSATGYDDQEVSLTLTGGTAGTAYTITTKILTTSGQTLEGVGILIVEAA